MRPIAQTKPLAVLCAASTKCPPGFHSSVQSTAAREMSAKVSSMQALDRDSIAFLVSCSVSPRLRYAARTFHPHLFA